MEQHCDSRYFGDKENFLRFTLCQSVLSVSSFCLSLYRSIYHIYTSSKYNMYLYV